MRKLRIVALAILSVIGISMNGGCGSTPKREGAQEARVSDLGAATGPVSQTELQQDVQRFVSEFHESLVQAMSPLLNSTNPEIRDRSLKEALLYATSAIDIATGPSPEVNLLDMIWFVRLCRLVVQDYWIPQVYGREGEPLLEAFNRLEENIWSISSKVMNDETKRQLIALQDQWRAEHPHQIRVEFLRFSEFSRLVGQESQAQADKATGVLKSVKTGVAIADSVLLLAERSLFLVQRMPFLLRLQAQIASRDIVSDLSRDGEMGSLVSNTTDLAVVMRQVASESRALVEAINNDILPPKAQRRPGYLLETVKSFQGGMDSAEKTLARTQSLLREAKSGGTSNIAAPFSAGLEETDRMVRRWVMYFLILGAGWSFFGWGGYYLAHRYSKQNGEREREPHHVHR